jgi:phage terminase small subunit
MALTPKQKAFADYYIECGNATEAAKKAGYKDYKSSGVEAAKTLKNPKVSAYIAERMGQQEKSRVADANEVIEFYTAVMRGEVKDQFGLDASLSDRLKAGDSLMKRYAAAADKNKTTMDKLDGLLREFKDAVKSEAD